MKKSFLAEYRISISKIVIIPFIILLVIFTPIIVKFPFLNGFLEIVGFLLTIIGVLGRIFASIFMGDNRDKTIVSTGLYATTRNPLYFFSFIGGLGIVLAYGSLIFLIIFLIIFSLYYYFVIKAEEKFLRNFFRDTYTIYKSKTPRFIPNFKLFKVENDIVKVSYKSVLKTIIDSSIFLVIVVILIVLKDINPLTGWLYIW